MMRIGWGQAEITPRGGAISLYGQWDTRITRQVNDPLRAAAIASCYYLKRGFTPSAPCHFQSECCHKMQITSGNGTRPDLRGWRHSKPVRPYAARLSGPSAAGYPPSSRRLIYRQRTIKLATH